jgi:hypothetical protein
MIWEVYKKVTVDITVKSHPMYLIMNILYSSLKKIIFDCFIFLLEEKFVTR